MRGAGYRANRGAAPQLMTTGEHVPAGQALEWGVVDEVETAPAIGGRVTPTRPCITPMGNR